CPHCPGKPWLKACPVMIEGEICNPVCGSISFQTPVVMITSPVQDTTMIVSMKVWVIDTSPCRTGCVVCAEAAAIAAEPMPDSFEKMPRATPNCTAIMIVEPKKPPVAAVPVNACEKISPKAAGTDW